MKNSCSNVFVFLICSLSLSLSIRNSRIQNSFSNLTARLSRINLCQYRVWAVMMTSVKVPRKTRAVRKLAGHSVSADGSLRYVLFVLVYLWAKKTFPPFPEPRKIFFFCFSKLFFFFHAKFFSPTLCSHLLSFIVFVETLGGWAHWSNHLCLVDPRFVICSLLFLEVIACLRIIQLNMTFDFWLQDEKKKKKSSNKIVELPIVVHTHGYSQAEFDKYFELEVSWWWDEGFDVLWQVFWD